MSPRARLPPLPARETDLLPDVRARLEAEGYTVYVNPDGSDYFDVVARRGEEVGLVELKRTDWKHLLVQAVARRGYGDWVVAVLPRRFSAERLRARADTELSRAIGIWWVGAHGLEVLREATPWSAGTRERFPDHRAALKEMLEAIASGAVPAGATWGGFPARTARRAGGRSAREWRLDEFDGAAAPPDG